MYSSFSCYYKLGQRHNKNTLSLAKKNNMKFDLKLEVIIVSTILKKSIRVALRVGLKLGRRV